MAKFINPFTDVGFKRIFGQEFSKPLLLDFLNNLLLGERHITDITLNDKEQPGHYDGDRSIIYDIKCMTDTGETIIVEMQNREHPNFKERTEYDGALKRYRDTLNVMRGAEMKGRKEGEAKGRAEGEAKGRAEGRAEGRADERNAIARKLKAMGLGNDDIAKATGLTPEEVAKVL